MTYAELFAFASEHGLELNPDLEAKFHRYAELLAAWNEKMNLTSITEESEVIEKHFTLDRNMVGPDHKASLEPQELKAMVHAIRNIEQALGTGIKQVSDSERANIAVARKSIVASTFIKKGETLSDDNLAVKRPGTGVTPMRWEEVVGTKAIKDYQPDEQIQL